MSSTPAVRSIDVDADGLATLADALSHGRYCTAGDRIELAAFAGRLRSMVLRPHVSPEIEPSEITAKVFRWKWHHFEDYPALWAYCADALPQRAEFIDQDTPISRRPAEPMDDLTKCLLAVFAHETERLTGERVDVTTKPVRFEDFYRELRYWREIEPPAKKGSHYCDGLADAVMMVRSLQFEREYLRVRGNKVNPLSDHAACKEVFRRVGWVLSTEVVPDETRIAVSNAYIHNDGFSPNGRSGVEIAFERLYRAVLADTKALEGHEQRNS